MCRTPNAAIYRECERKSSRSLVSYWTFAPRCAALLWPPGEIHGAETRLSGIPGRTPVGILRERRLLREGIRRGEGLEREAKSRRGPTRRSRTSGRARDPLQASPRL